MDLSIANFFRANLVLLSCLIIVSSKKGNGAYIAHGCTGTYMNLSCSSVGAFVVVTDLLYEVSKAGPCQYTLVKCTHYVLDSPVHVCTGLKSCKWLVPKFKIEFCGESDHAVVKYTCAAASAVSNICDATVSVLDEQAGYIASPGYTALHSAAPGAAGQHHAAAPYLCTLTVQAPPDRAHAALFFYVRDLNFRLMHELTTPTDEQIIQNSTTTAGQESCLQFTESQAGGTKEGFSHTVCSLKEVPGGGLVFRTTSRQVDVKYWSTNDDFNDFLIYYVAHTVESTTSPTLPAHAGQPESTTVRDTAMATENQLFPPTPAAPGDFTTADYNATDWDNNVAGQRESKPWVTAVGAAIGCIAGILLIVLIVVLVVDKRRKDTKKEPTRIYDDVPSPTSDTQSHKGSELNGQVYENMHAHTNTGFVDELNVIIGKNANSKPKTVPISEQENDKGDTERVVDAKSPGAAVEICDEEAYDEESEVPENSGGGSEPHRADDNIYVNNNELVSENKDDTATVAVVNGSLATRDIPEKKRRRSPQIDLEKAQQIYENAAFPVKYSRIATPRISERSRQSQGSKKGNPPARKGYHETVQPVLHRLERPKIAVRRHPSVVSDSELIYDDVPDETAEDEQHENTPNNGAPVKPPIKPKPRLSKIVRNKNKNKTPSPRLKSVDDTIMVDNEVYITSS